MLTITGAIAFALILLASPYRTVQRRWRTLAPPLIPVWAHANISVLALVAVLLHAGLKLGSIGAELTWLATLMFVAAFVSGTGARGSQGLKFIVRTEGRSVRQRASAR